MAGKTVAEVAEKIFAVERFRAPAGSSIESFERRFGNPDRNPFLGWNPGICAVRSFQLANVVLDGEFRGLFNSDGFIRGTGYLMPDELMMSLGIDSARLIKASDQGVVIIGCNIAHANYFHWCTQALPAIDDAIQRERQERRVSLALPKLNAWQEESLCLLGHAGIRRVIVDDRTKQYALDRVEYSEILNGGVAFSLSESARRTYSRLRAAVDVEPSNGRKIYVARTDSPSRRMSNEDAVIKEVQRRGFEVVVPGSLTFTEQIRLFRSAGLVVGAHGAGVTNIAFCEPGTVVYELVPAHYKNACFCNLAHICGLRYWADAFESDGDGLPNLREWQSDTGQVIERLGEIEMIILALQDEARRRPIGAMDYLRGKPGVLPNYADSERPATAPPATSDATRPWWRRLFRS